MARTRAADYEEKRLGILEHAATVFATQGIKNSSMAYIAERSGVSKALLYHYYPSKNALIFDIICSHLLALDEALTHVSNEMKGEPAERRLRRLIHAILENYRNADDRHKVLLDRDTALTDTQREKVHSLERRIIVHISSAIRDIAPHLEQERSLLKPVTMSLFGMLNWAYMWFRPNGSVSRPEYADLLTDLMLKGVNGIQLSQNQDGKFS
ncbi:MAG: TetR/AcrR family transcriptional regulator [Lautropia sp.]|nr:TetR/AcrR family transcriptional regulator [Lautropia sp.]